MSDNNTATAQELFDQACAHLRTQKRQAVNHSFEGKCLYRLQLPDGEILKCAAGALIRDEEYAPWMDSSADTGIRTILHDQRCPRSMKDRLSPHLELVVSLQRAHDQFLPEKWETELQQVALSHRLTYTRPD